MIIQNQTGGTTVSHLLNNVEFLGRHKKDISVDTVNLLQGITCHNLNEDQFYICTFCFDDLLEYLGFVIISCAFHNFEAGISFR